MIHFSQYNQAWPVEPLGNLCDIVIGRTPSRSQAEYWGGDLPWLSIKDMNQGRVIDVTKEQITELGVSASGARLVPKGSVLLSFKLSIGKVGIANRDLYTNEAIAALPITQPDLVDRDYLFWTLVSIHLEEETDKAVKGKTLNKGKIERLQIPLPPVDEQKRITAILDKADAIRRKRQQALRLTEDFLRSVFLDMFGDPVTNPKVLPKLPLSEFGEIVTGNTPSRKDPANYGDHLEWIKSDNINTPSHYLTRSSEMLSAAGAEKARTVPAGSILVTCIAGSRDCIGNTAMSDRRVAFNQQINAIVPNEKVDAKFLYTQLLVAKKAVQAASTNSMKGMVSKSTFSAIEFLRPSQEEQAEFGGILNRYEQLLQSANLEARDAESLFASLQQRAFRGEL